eukprot:jgi/Hompol1/3411/HPOL_003229-RA
MESALVSVLSQLGCPHLDGLADPRSALFGRSSNQQLWESIQHYLLVALDASHASKFIGCYPATDPSEHREFRQVAWKLVDSLRKPQQPSPLQFASLRKSDFDSYSGDRFQRAMLALASEVLANRISQMAADSQREMSDSAAQSSCLPPPSLPAELHLKLLRAQVIVQGNELAKLVMSIHESQQAWASLASDFLKQEAELQSTLLTSKAKSYNGNAAIDASEIAATEIQVLDHDNLQLRPSQELALEIQRLSEEGKFQLFDQHGALDLAAYIETWTRLHSQ